MNYIFFFKSSQTFCPENSNKILFILKCTEDISGECVARAAVSEVHLLPLIKVSNVYDFLMQSYHQLWLDNK